MHSIKKSMTRTLIILLILRVIAAPITLRPISYRPQAKKGFVVRVCAWPAQRAVRSNVTAFSVPDHDDSGLGEIVERLPVPSAWDLAHLDFAQPFQRLKRLLHDPGARRSIDSPRC
jgi:hypothetical protein